MNYKFSKTSLGRFRLIGITEGYSYLILLGIAMPLKYMFGIPIAVKLVGWIHGILFILYVAALINVKFDLNWTITKSLKAFIAALIPFGTFILDKELVEEEKNMLGSGSN
jgi:integral membrane protein